MIFMSNHQPHWRLYVALPFCALRCLAKIFPTLAQTTSKGYVTAGAGVRSFGSHAGFKESLINPWDRGENCICAGLVWSDQCTHYSVTKSEDRIGPCYWSLGGALAPLVRDTRMDHFWSRCDYFSLDIWIAGMPVEEDRGQAKALCCCTIVLSPCHHRSSPLRTPAATLHPAEVPPVDHNNIAMPAAFVLEETTSVEWIAMAKH